MRVLVQRVVEASCVIDNQKISEIGDGYLLLVGFTDGDTEEIIHKMVDKVLKLRIFPDECGVMNKNILEVEGTSILSISQFTLYANTKKGNRPSYIEALNGKEASFLYDLFNQELSKHIKVGTGIFGSDMKIYLVNNGPTTIWLEV